MANKTKADLETELAELQAQILEKEKQTKEQIEALQHERDALYARLKAEKTGAIKVISEKYVCQKGDAKGKAFRFKPGHNAFRLPADILATAQVKAAKDLVVVNDQGITLAEAALKSPVIMEYLIEVESGMIEEVTEAKK